MLQVARVVGMVSAAAKPGVHASVKVCLQGAMA